MSESYTLRCIDSKSGFKGVPFEYLKGDKADMDKIKLIIIEAVENNHELKMIEEWDVML